MMKELCEKVIEVRMVSDRVMIVVVLEEDLLRLICEYDPQCCGSFEEKHSFYYELKGEWDALSADYLVMFLGDIN